MADITVQILKDIRADIADMRADFNERLGATNERIDATNREVHRLAIAVEHNGERLGSMVSVLRLAVGRQDDLDDRIRRLETEAFGPGRA